MKPTNDAKIKKVLAKGFSSVAETKPVMNDFLKLKHMVKFNGNQEIMGVYFPMFTDRLTGSTFMVEKGAKLKDMIDAVRNSFKEAK